MKKLMLIMFVCCSFISCGLGSIGNKYDGKMVKDAQGNYYKLEHSMFDVYFIKEHKLEKEFK